MFMLPKVHGIFKTQCLEIVQSRVEHIDNLFLQLKDKNIKDILKHR